MWRSRLSTAAKQSWQSTRSKARRFSTGPKDPMEGKQQQRFQRSSSDRAPKVVVAALGIGVASLYLSTVAYFEITRPRCDAMDSVLTHEEPITHTKFPLTLYGYSAPDSTHWLVTASVRCMLNMCSFDRARAYAYGVYVTSKSAEKAKDAKTPEEAVKILLPDGALHQGAVGLSENLVEFIPASKFQGAKPGYVFKMDIPADRADGTPQLGYHKDMVSIVSNTAASDCFYDSMILRMHFLRDAGGDHLAHGFDKTLLWRIRSVQGREGDGKEALRKLNRFISSRGVWTKGTVLEFVRSPGGVLEFRVDGSRALVIHSEAMSWAIFDAYLGPKGHLKSECKKELLERIHEVHSIVNA